MAVQLKTSEYRFYPENYGALGNGVHDDLPALQAAVDAADAIGGGTIVLGKSTYNIYSGTWKIGRANTQHHINIEGVSPNLTIISCNTSAGSAAIYLNLEKYVILKGFSVVNQGPRGGYGIRFGGDNGPGMQTNGNLVQHILFSNFQYGAFMSGGIGTASDIEFDHCIYNNNDYGFYSADFNSLDYLHIMPEMYGNGVGMFISTGNMTVMHGTSNGNGNDFYIAGGNDGTVKIVGFRAEIPTGTWLIAKANNYLSIEDCIVHPRELGVEVINTLAGIRVVNTVLNGYITAHIFENSAIILDNVSVNMPGGDWSIGNQYSSATPPFGPGFRMTNNIGFTPNSRVYIRSVFDTSTNTMYPDISGIAVARPDGMRAIIVS